MKDLGCTRRQHLKCGPDNKEKQFLCLEHRKSPDTDEIQKSEAYNQHCQGKTTLSVTEMRNQKDGINQQPIEQTDCNPQKCMKNSSNLLVKIIY